MDIKPENNPDSLEDIHSSFRFLKESINNLSTDRDTDQNPDSDFQSSFQALRQKIFSLATTIDTKLRDSTLVPDVVSSLRGLEDNIRNLYESMPAESSETPSTESGNMAVISGEKMQEVVENSVLTSSQQKNESMEVEEGQNPQVAAAPSDNAEISFWQVQKLPGYKEDMKKMLEEGLPSYEVKALTAERLTELLGKIDEGDLKSESNRDVITRLLASKIENSRENQLELAKKCKEYIDSLTKVFESLDESYYMDLICSFATFKSYLDLKSNYLDNFASYLSGYEVWEIKSNDHLKEVANVDEVNAMKAQRRWKIKNLTALDKLIKNIIKLKNANDSKKIWGLKDKYEEALKSKKPEFVEKTPKANKRKHKNLDEPAASDLKELETETLQSLKKMKLNSAKTSTVKGAPGKASVSKAGAAVQNNTEVKQPEEASNSMSQEDSKKVAGKESAKKVVNEKEKEKEKKDNNQKNLMNFFKKKPAESTEPKAENKAPQAVQTSRFRCLGSLAPRAVWNEARAEAFENVFAGTGEQLSISELLAQARDQQLQYQQKHSGKTRKIFISLHDSCKRIKGKYDTSSRMIHGRNPLVKDEAVIDYNIDSEEEMQEQNAENIDEDRPSDNNESDLDEEDEEDFIVPDGYVSPIEKPEDGSDDEEKGDDKNHIRFKEDLDFKAKPKAFFFSMIDDYEAGKDWQLDDYLNNFKIIKLVEEEYPLKPKKAKENLLTAGKTKHNPEAINDDDIIRELLLSLHGELSKPDTVKKINAKFPSCSKNSVERKISEFETGELIKKDKLPGETKARWIIQKEFFLKYGTEDEYKNILAEKQEKELERQKLEKEKREAEKKLKQMTQALEQSELKKANKENEDDNEKENSDDNKVIFVGGKKTVQTELPFAVPKDTESTVMNVERSLLQSFPEKMEILDSTPRTYETAQPNQIEMENV